MNMRLSILLLCLAPWLAEAKLNVVATLPDLAAIAEAVGGDDIKVTSLARPTEDPHFVDPKPSLILKLNKADVLVEGGAGLEIGWLPALVQSARNRAILVGGKGRVVCNHGVRMLEVPRELDRSQGDIHAAGNPHYLMDPVNAKIVATNITETLCALEASACETFRKNLAAFSERVDQALLQWVELLRPYQGRRVVAYHNSWPYFAQRFGLSMDLFLEPKPGIPPSPAHLAAVVREMETENIHVIIVDPYLNRRTAETVARNTRARVLDVAQFPGGVKGTEDGYIALMDHLVRSIARALAEGGDQP